MAKRKFILFHLSLKEIRQLDIATMPMSKEEWLRHVFSERFIFTHRSIDYHWVPNKNLEGNIFGVIERQRSRESHLPPEQGGGEITKDEWVGAYLILDPKSHFDGQKLAIENDNIGDPSSLLKVLMTKFNQLPEKPYIIEIESIFNPESFWEFSLLRENLLKNIKFKFVAPNMWGTRNALDEDLKETRDQTNANRIEIGLESSDGVVANSQIVRDGVEYAQRGAGTITATGLDGERFSSEVSPKTTSIPKEEASPEQTRRFFSGVIDVILGRNQRSVEE